MRNRATKLAVLIWFASVLFSTAEAADAPRSIQLSASLLRVQWALATVSLLVLAAAAWVWLLRRRVRQQTCQLRGQLERETALEQQYREIFDGASDLIFTHDLAGRFTAFNRATCRILGYSPEELSSRTIDQVLAPEYQDHGRQLRETALRAGAVVTCQCALITKDGRRVLIEISLRMTLKNGKPVAVNGIARDITQRKQAEATLAYERDMLRTLMDNSPDLIYFKDRESRFVHFSKAFCSHFRVADPDQLKDKSDFDFYAESHARPAYNDEQEIIRTGHPIVGKLEEETHTDGRVTWCLTTKMPWRDQTGKIIGTFGISKDMTALKQAEAELVAANRQLQRQIEERVRIHEALRVSDERFSKAFQCSPIPLAIQRRADQRFLDVNQSFLGLSGYTAVELLRHSGRELQLWLKEVNLITTPFTPEGQLRNQSCQLRRRDGTIRQILLSAEPLSLGATPCLLVIVEDVTDQLKLEAQLRQAQKMEVVGRLSAGIAHEFNNLLTVIQGNTGLLLAARSEEMDKRVLLDQIMQASQRAAAFTRQLLAFTRKQVLQTRPLDLSATVLRLKKMLGRLIGEKYELNTNCPNDMPAVLADEGGVEQILINLLLNARDACPRGGVIRVETAFQELDEAAVVGRPGARAGRFVCLAVADQGCGMSPEVLSRIFDPFFTTKEVGKGTGLGLSTIQGIVKQHDGWIEVASEVGQGTTFRVFFPVCAQAAGSLPANGKERSGAADSGRGETVLVVEDESEVRSLACAALQRRGYRVLEAADGHKALELWQRNPAQVDLLLTDMVMPGGMSGGALAKALRAGRPQLKVIYTSGYSPEIMREDSLLAQEVNFLPKPYELHTLLRAVRLCLNGGRLEQREVRVGPQARA